jgi:hypothetical protein
MKISVEPLVDFYVKYFCGYKKSYCKEILKLFEKQEWGGT